MENCNLFSYCGNNPVNNSDPSGSCYYDKNGNWCHDNWEYLGGYVRQPDPRSTGNNSAIRENNDTYTDSSYVNAYGISGAIGLGLDVNVGLSYIYDTSGNHGLAITIGIGGGLGATYGVTDLVQSNYTSIEDAAGPGVTIGGTVAFIGLEDALGKDLQGESMAIGSGTALEFHANISYTWVINLYGGN